MSPPTMEATEIRVIMDKKITPVCQLTSKDALPCKDYSALEAEIEKLEDWQKVVHKDNKDLRAEIERLRAALANVIEAAPYGKAADIAMEALNGGDDGD